MTQFAICTFCFGERYHKQVNRMISEIDSCEFKPPLVVVTDDVTKIMEKDFVHKFDISKFNPEYKKFSESYYSFDFSVKRYALLAAINLGYTKMILTDCDAVPNKDLFNEKNILRGFVKNSIQGQVTYNFKSNIESNSSLGFRFLKYENYFGVEYDKNLLDFMPEDCIQFIDIEMGKFYNFLRVWDECIKYKKDVNLPNTPAGNIDEMCFSALNCGITVGNNSSEIMNVMTPIHDKWYDSNFNKESVENRKKIIVTSIYELNYDEVRGGAVYKNFDLLTQTIRNIIFDEFKYIIYTNEFTYKKHNLGQIFNKENITIKFVELNSDFYINYLNPIRERRINEGEIWDRIHSVKNYIEVILNKIEFMINESQDNNTDLVWVDSGLFGTSCSNAWRDKMNEICHTKNFVDKIFEKINENDFISLLGKHILMNYEVREKIQSEFNLNPYVVPGCLFGGKSNLILDYFKNYKETLYRLVNKLNDYTSEQEILYLLLNDKKIKFYEFDDWDDLQKSMLQLIDLYDETSYDKNDCKNKKKLSKVELENLTFNNFTEVADFFGIDKGTLHESHRYTEIYEKFMKDFLDKNPTIVEIGINDSRFPGGCLKFWDKIFKKMNYFGYDITDCSHLEFNREKIKLYQGDQNNVTDLENFINTHKIGNNIDFIIDDGSHIHEHILTSFKILFKYLKNDGIYFIEDLHAGWAERDKTISEIKKFLELNFKNEYVLDEENYKLLIIKKL